MSSCMSCSPTNRAVNSLGGFGGWAEDQVIREEYQALANQVRRLAPTLTGALGTAVNLYLARIASVIARGAQATDVRNIVIKLGEWEQVILTQAAAEHAAVARVVAEQQAAALKAEAQIVAAEAKAAKIAEAEAAARRAAAARATAAATQTAATQAVVVTATADPVTGEPYRAPVAEPLMAGLLDNPVLIAVAVGALIFLLKK